MCGSSGNAASPVGTGRVTSQPTSAAAFFLGKAISTADFLEANPFVGGNVCVVFSGPAGAGHTVLMQSGQYIELVECSAANSLGGSASRGNVRLAVGATGEAEKMLHDGRSTAGFVLFDANSLAALRAQLSGLSAQLQRTDLLAVGEHEVAAGQTLLVKRDGQTVSLRLADGRMIRWFNRTEVGFTAAMLQQLLDCLQLVEHYLNGDGRGQLTIQPLPHLAGAGGE